jgi:outer membrane protein OmpA-like peptidoglycan-associated protein
LHQARGAIEEAKKAGVPEDKIKDLERRHLQARGIFYACQDAEASRLAQGIIADARARPAPVAAPPPPPPNRPPRARVKGPAEVEVNAPAAFSAEESSDPDGDRLTYNWDFGDGSPAARTAVPNASHQYTRPGNYTVRMMVDDSKGGSDTATAPVGVIRRMVLQESKDKVLFDFDKATLRPEAQRELATVVQEMQENPTLRAELVGHADAIGSDQYNMGLSRRRAESTKNYLVSRGISADRIRTDAKGEREPIAPNNTKEGRAQNRRVEITLRPLAMQ